MTRIWTRSEALQTLTNVNGSFLAGTCKDSASWFVCRNLEDLHEFVLKETSFLNDHEPSLYLRLLCLKLDVSEPPICQFCNDLRTPIFCESRFRPTCKKTVCILKFRSQLSTQMHANFSDEKKKQIAKKIGASNSGSFSDKFDYETAQRLRQKISATAKCRIQTQSEKKKRIDTRKSNNVILDRDWMTDECKRKISESNKKTHQDPVFQQRLKDSGSRAQMKKNQSATMKKKIELGEFTPNSNNWRRSVTFSLDYEESLLRFRSKWEAIFYLVTVERSGEKLEYESIRIPNLFEGDSRVYIVDFFSPINKKLIEIRPTSRQNIPKEIAKFDAARQWAETKGINFELIDEHWFYANRERIDSFLDSHQEIKAKLNFRCPTLPTHITK